MHSRYRILRILADGNFHSGQALGADLGLSRSAVWKAVRQLKERGVEIYAVPGRGYQLATGLEFLDREKIYSAMEGGSAQMITQMEIFPELASTNDYLLGQLAAPGADSGRVCLAEYQYQGRGRQGRRWVAPFGKNLCLSLLWKFSAGPTALGGLSLAVGVALIRALTRLGVAGVGLKWPNDLYWRNRKLGGILLEVSGEATGPAHVVIGVGLNLEIGLREGEGIDQAWVDLATITGADPLSRNRVCGLVLHSLCGAMDEFSRHGLAPFLPEWRRHDAVSGHMVNLLLPDRSLTGRALGVDDHGALLLEIDGSVQRMVSGDLSLRMQA